MSWRGPISVLPLPREGPGQGQGALLDLPGTAGMSRLRPGPGSPQRHLGGDVGARETEVAGNGVGPSCNSRAIVMWETVSGRAVVCP
jgi:hypothetical protein